jgi:hypothetical protein
LGLVVANVQKWHDGLFIRQASALLIANSRKRFANAHGRSRASFTASTGGTTGESTRRYGNVDILVILLAELGGEDFLERESGETDGLGLGS